MKIDNQTAERVANYLKCGNIISNESKRNSYFLFLDGVYINQNYNLHDGEIGNNRYSHKEFIKEIQAHNISDFPGLMDILNSFEKKIAGFDKITERNSEEDEHSWLEKIAQNIKNKPIYGDGWQLSYNSDKKYFHYHEEDLIDRRDSISYVFDDHEGLFKFLLKKGFEYWEKYLKA